MNQQKVERKLREVHAKLVSARVELAVAEEQFMAFAGDADDARIRSLVAETPLADREWQEASRHAAAMERGLQLARQRVDELERQQDELLGKLVV
jgi:hypothetical protein